MTGTGSAGLVLSGGGARGAYQAGALRALAERWEGPPFSVVTGSSIGAVNGAMVAEGLEAGDLAAAARRLDNAWRELGAVVRLNWKGFAAAALRALRCGLSPEVLGAVRSLLDETPVAQALARYIPAHRRLGDYRRVELVVTATDLHAGCTVTFDRTTPEVPVLDAVLASAAYPLAFPSRNIRGHWHVDGGVFDNAPLRHAIRRGVGKVVVIATTPGCGAGGPPAASGPFADVYAVLRRLWPLMLDRLLYDDLREALRVNEVVGFLEQARRAGEGGGDPLLRQLERRLGYTSGGRRKRQVEIVLICPSKELDPPGTFGFHDRRAVARALDQGYRDALEELSATGRAETRRPPPAGLPAGPSYR